MDTALQEITARSQGDATVEVLVKLQHRNKVPDGLQIVTQFDDIVTGRLKVQNIHEVWESDVVFSLKASRQVSPEIWEELGNEQESAQNTRPNLTAYSGKGVVIGIIDWGFDFTHPNFLEPSTQQSRILALWDQTAAMHPSSGKYGYGHIHTKAEIDTALVTDRPFESLGYHPAKGDPDGSGAHGTHVLDIAAGNGTIGECGMAPQAYMVVVHLSASNSEGIANLGDSGRILEAIDFIASIAGERPLVINMSVGKHGGSHHGNSLVEQGMDNFLREKPGRMIVNSAGNYYSAQIHASGQLSPGQMDTIPWVVEKNDKTVNELEVWYDARDVFSLELSHVDHLQYQYTVALGSTSEIMRETTIIGRIYHRANEPNTRNHHIDIFLYPEAPAGEWKVALRGVDIVYGQYHVWIERDGGCKNCQSHIATSHVDPYYTTGSICNGLYNIAVGAYDSSDPHHPVTFFSSAGPTADGRQKPNLLAPGMRILAARSSPFGDHRSRGELTTKSGTSMAAPHVTGAVALLFEAAGAPLTIPETRRAIISSVAPPPHEKNKFHYGNGYLNIESLLVPFSSLQENSAMNPLEVSPIIEIAHEELTESLEPWLPMEAGDLLQDEEDKRDIRMVIAKDAIIRTPPESGLTNTGKKFQAAILVKVTENHTINDSKAYVLATELVPKGDTRKPISGWTLAKNLKDNNASDLDWPKVKAALVSTAISEYHAWTQNGLACERDSEHILPRLKAYWATVKLYPSNQDLKSSSWQNDHPWSAAFISYVVSKAGAGDHFYLNSAHSCYIAWARNNQRNAYTNNPFWAFSIESDEAKWPQPGDMICQNRKRGNYTVDTIFCGAFSHVDVVVETDKKNRRIIVIGGNVDDRVARRVIRLTPQGLVDKNAEWELEPVDKKFCESGTSKGSQKPFFAVIKFMGGRTARNMHNTLTTSDAAQCDCNMNVNVDETYDEDFDSVADQYNSWEQMEDFESYETEGMGAILEPMDQESHEEASLEPMEHLGQHEACMECTEHWEKSLPRSWEQEAYAHFVLGRTTRNPHLSGLKIVCRPGGSLIQATIKSGDVVILRAFGSGHARAFILQPIPLPMIQSPARELPKSNRTFQLYSLQNMPNSRIPQSKQLATYDNRLLRNAIIVRRMPQESDLSEGKRPKRPKVETFTVQVRTDFMRWERQVLVRDFSPGFAVPNAKVEIEGTDISAITDTNGNAQFSIKDVPDGDYTVHIMHQNPKQRAVTDAGPSLAESLDEIPSRMYKKLSITVTISNGNLTKATVPAGTKHGGIGNRYNAHFSNTLLPVDWKPSFCSTPQKSGEGPRDGGIEDLQYVIVHHTGGDKVGPALNTFLNPETIVSAHYLIDLNGHVIKLKKDSHKANHAGCAQWKGNRYMNKSTIGIEIVNGSMAYTAAQYDSLIDLLEQLVRAYESHLPANHIIGHSDIGTVTDDKGKCLLLGNLGRKSGDPGNHFDWQKLEAKGLGLIPFPFIELGSGYGNYFTLYSDSLRLNDADSSNKYGGTQRNDVAQEIIHELQEDLAAIGYATNINGTMDARTVAAVKAFQEHIFSGTRRPLLYGGKIGDQVDPDKYNAQRGRVNKITAMMIKRVRP